MAHELKAVEYNIKVLFDTKKLSSDPFQFQVDGGPISEDFVLEINKNVGVFRFYLQTLTEDLEHLGTLATSPLQWLTAAGTSAPMPPCFYFQREGDSKMTLIDLNGIEIPDKVTFNFEVAVVYKGRTYTSPDPTIINVQPPPVQPMKPVVKPAQAGELRVS